MEQSDCWNELEIAPTDDLAEIRRAYARKLKTIDVQTDPRAFIVLRAAFETARDRLSRSGPPGWQLPDQEGLGETEGFSTPCLEAMEAIKALLFGSEGRDLIFSALSQHTKWLIDHAHSVSLSRSEAIEEWIARAIVDGVPRSNGMLLPAIVGFGWDLRVEHYDCPPSIAAVVDRYDDLHYLYTLGKLNPHYRLAWTALTEGVANPSEIDLGSMTTLLGIVQYQKPGLQDDIDPGHFRRWLDFLEAKRAAERQTLVRTSAQPAPPSTPVRDAITSFGLMATGTGMCIGACIYFAGQRLGMLSYGALLVIGAMLIAVGRMNRTEQKRRKCAETYHVS